MEPVYIELTTDNKKMWEARTGNTLYHVVGGDRPQNYVEQLTCVHISHATEGRFEGAVFNRSFLAGSRKNWDGDTRGFKTLALSFSVEKVFESYKDALLYALHIVELQIAALHKAKLDYKEKIAVEKGKENDKQSER